jgi:hypothetical protein
MFLLSACGSGEAPTCHMSTRLDDAVRHHTQGPQGRLQSEEPRVHTVVRCLPIEADGRLRYRIKSDIVERVVTEDELSYFSVACREIFYHQSGL